MLSVFFYLLVFAVSCIYIYVVAPEHKGSTAVFWGKRNCVNRIISAGKKRRMFFALISCIPIILLYGLRVDIGKDYPAYEQIFSTLHNTPFPEYIFQHSQGNGVYYVEVGYYLLNRLLPSYRTLLFVNIVIILIPMWIAVFELKEDSIPSLSLFIYMCTQFIFAMNGVRFVIALSFILMGFAYMINRKYKKCILSIVLASMFHTSAAICILFLFLGHSKKEKINVFRDILFYLFIITFFYNNKSIIFAVSKISLFHRYFTKDVYSFSEGMTGSIFWMLHILPVIIPLLVACGSKIFRDNKSELMFKICIAQIPFRMMGLYNTWFTRLARIPQVIEAIFIPYMLNTIENKKTKRALMIYYIIWYIFYFSYYIFVNDQGSSIPYQWVLSK